MRTGVRGESIPLIGGEKAESVHLVTYNDGRRVVVKVSSVEQADAEMLASIVGQAMGAPVPRAVRLNDKTVVMEYVEGLSGREVQFNFENRPNLHYWRSPEGRLLGVFDVLTDNRDRNGNNWRVRPDDDVAGIDHDAAFRGFGDPLDPSTNLFVRDYVVLGPDGTQIIDHPLSQADIQHLRDVLGPLRPEFERLGRSGWHEELMGRLDRLAEHATGTDPLYGEHAALPTPDHAPFPSGVGNAEVNGDAPLTQASLDASVRSGVRNASHIVVDGSESMRDVTYNNGRHVVEKVAFTATIAHADVLTAMVGQAIHAPVARAVLVGERTVVMEFVDGVHGGRLHPDYRSRPDLPYWDSVEGWRLGLLDLLVDNGDRTGRSWLVRDGRIVGIGHNDAFAHLGVNAADNPFVARYVRRVGMSSAEIINHPLSPADVQFLRNAVGALRPEFAKLGRIDWYDQVMGRIDELGRHATGANPLYPEYHPHSQPNAGAQGQPNRVADLLNGTDRAERPGRRNVSGRQRRLRVADGTRRRGGGFHAGRRARFRRHGAAGPCHGRRCHGRGSGGPAAADAGLPRSEPADGCPRRAHSPRRRW